MRRRWFLLGGLVLFFLGLRVLDVGLGELIPSEGGRQLAGEFFAAAFQPALDYEDVSIREVGEPFFSKVGKAAWLTVKYAVVAMSLALVLGVAGGILGSRSWWNRPSRALEALRLFIRLLATALRSVHELIWAILFLAAVGTSPVAAMLAMALPYGGTLAKVFSELLDEANQSPAKVMQSAGGSGMASFLGTAVGAMPDLLTYAMYRLECAVRSSAVLGFVGVPTLGYEIKVSFEDGHYREIWTFVFALLVIVLFFEWWGGRIRKMLVTGVPSRTKLEAGASVARLWQQRGTSLFLRVSGALIVALVSAGWLLEDRWGAGLSAAQRWENLQRFGKELVPYPVQESGDWSKVWGWLGQLMREEGWEAIWRTFHLGTAAVLLAGAVALMGLVWSSRSLATIEPRGIPVAGGRVRRLFGQALRLLAVLARSAPEYLLAFLLLQIFGPTMWALIFALAIHNSGILSRLGGEVVDNNDSGAAEMMLSSGASREACFLGALLPEGFNRMVLFLFYRWETCIREATILGMLGVGSLGFLISEARVSFYYDELLLWVVLGASLVFVGDLASDFVRAKLRAGGQAVPAGPACGLPTVNQ
jgi:phosphonate transport system permease protein